MAAIGILFDKTIHPIPPGDIRECIRAFGNSYCDASKYITDNSAVLDNDGDVFINCASHILSKFGMTRSGPFKTDIKGTLHKCWDAVGSDLTAINKSIRNSGLSRDRYILEIEKHNRIELISDIWQITKKLLPFTMGKYSYGLVGASKILFSVLPEIVLPVDNAEWRHVFQTVDIGDVLHRMISDIQQWEKQTGVLLNELDQSKRLTTLPSVYNVMAMNSRP